MLLKRVNPKKYIKLRILATVIDYGTYFFFFYVYVQCLGTPTENGTEVTGLIALPIFAFWFLYFVGLEAYNNATVGHDICKLIVLKTDGEKINVIDAFKRRLLDPVDILIYGIPALICINNTPKFQRLGDLFAGTLVVKKTDVVETLVVF